jgi:parallel beta-helix repeat protein
MQADGMTPKSISGLIVVIILASCFISVYNIETCEASVLPKFYVDDDYNSNTPGWQVDHFDKIQDAISNSVSGDRIVVYAGTYEESITITHQIDLFGEDRSTTIIDGGDSNDVINILASYVNISHFTIRDSGSVSNNSGISINSGNAIITDNRITSGKNGILINNCDSNIIYDNIITSNSGVGIYMNHSDSNQITYNTITSNTHGLFIYNSSSNDIENNSAIQSNSLNGVFLNETSDSNNIRNNNITSNTYNGIFLNDHCDYNTIYNNDIYGNSDSGIRLENSSSNTFQSNAISTNTEYGIMIVGSNNTIQSNTVNKNSEHGIFLFADDNNIITGNTIKRNTKDGIRLSNSTNDSIYTNEISNNLRYGIYLDYFTINNLIYNNYIHRNLYNGSDKSISKNHWNTTITSGSNIAGGSYIFGNYWGSYDEVSEGATDSDGNGIADSSFTIYGSNKDYGAILDGTSPVLGSPQVSPSTQTAGGYVYISISATDNIEIKDVYLYILDPNSQASNFSIYQNRTGSTFYCNQQYSTLGKYTYYLSVKDPWNWADSNTGSFYVNEGTAPSITDNSASTGSPSQVFSFNATVTDDADSASALTVKVHWSHGSHGANYTMVNTGDDYFQINVQLDNTTDNLVYTIYAEDRWGNDRTTAQTTVTITDNTAPTITIDKKEYSDDGVIKTYTVGATITDNTEVSDVSIEYWEEGGTHQTATMDKTSSSYYEKVINLADGVDIIYCIITATDPSGNEKDTQNPFANHTGPYTGLVSYEITFDASQSFDLDGSISSYAWTFGDGTDGTGETVEHAYSTNGNYTVTLVVTDNAGKTHTVTTYALVIQSTQLTTSSATMNQIENLYDVNLTTLFYGLDTSGDSVVDIFVDPNNKLDTTHTGTVDINGDIVFLIYIIGQNSKIPSFMWNTSTDEIVNITYVEGTLSNITEPDDNNHVTANVTLNKTEEWIYLKISDPDRTDINNYDITGIVSVTRNGTSIDSDKIYRVGSKVYILDDPDVEYQITYSCTPPTLDDPTFSPPENSYINADNPTITISYDVPVYIIKAEFYRHYDVGSGIELIEDIVHDLVRIDEKTFTYTPPSNLKDGIYRLYILVEDDYGNNNTRDPEPVFNYQSYYQEEAVGSPLLMIWITIGIVISIIFAIFILKRYKNITFESFIYFKNKKIIPFFKPIIFGPLKLDVDDEKVTKAEFYVNGKLKQTLTEKPFIWKFDDPAFLKHNIETKVYDESGNSSSSGEMIFYIFNPPKLFK